MKLGRDPMRKTRNLDRAGVRKLESARRSLMSATRGGANMKELERLTWRVHVLENNLRAVRDSGVAT